jgi:hypothetical protein
MVLDNINNIRNMTDAPNISDVLLNITGVVVRSLKQISKANKTGDVYLREVIIHHVPHYLQMIKSLHTLIIAIHQYNDSIVRKFNNLSYIVALFNNKVMDRHMEELKTKICNNKCTSLHMSSDMYIELDRLMFFLETGFKTIKL